MRKHKKKYSCTPIGMALELFKLIRCPSCWHWYQLHPEVKAQRWVMGTRWLHLHESEPEL